MGNKTIQQASTLVIFSALTRPLVIGSALVIAIFATNARAAQPTVFMLQFGSFETKQEADAKIKAIGDKHAGMLAKYPAVIREITMPPDNLTVYRTQAGPAKTREDAQSVCAQLASQGDECYVVETAMVIPGTAPAVQQAGIVPAVEDEKTIHTDSKPIPARDPENIKTIEKVISPVAEESKTAMLKTMDEAANAPRLIPQPNAAPIPAPKRAQQEEDDDDSFWSWLDSDDDEDEKDAWAMRKLEADAIAQKEAAARRAAPVDDVATQDMAALAPPAPIAPAAPPAEAAPQPLTPPVAESAPLAAPPIEAAAPPASNPFSPPPPVLAPESSQPFQQQAAPLPIPPADAQLGNQGLRLPPPPPPTEAAREQMARGEMAPAPAAPFASGPAPVLAAPESTGSIVTSELPAAPFKKQGEVQVGEAKRVPLSETKKQEPVEQAASTVVGVNEPPQVAENVPPPPPATPITPPSSAMPQKTLWAHIHYFPDQQAALSFWDAYRRAHPDFPVVRVRTTSSLVARQQGDMRVSLRIGPFAQQGFINILCHSVQEKNENVECGAITDMGASASTFAPRDRYAQSIGQSARYANMTAPQASGFWVQLGSFTTADEAKMAWEDVRTRNADALDELKPAIISPKQGSQSQPIFRLRTGPFASQMAAKDVCSRVKVNQGSCLVVSD
ncbi:MAG: SPOR domain-containing protein [Alphaproteobacteria bacterium]|nr:SPOR domain-containing protein [Alphaproteobacteria bacterium]